MRIGIVLKRWRLMGEMDLRTAAKQIGIGHTTLMRIENGKMPDGQTLSILLAWLLMPQETEVTNASNVS